MSTDVSSANSFSPRIGAGSGQFDAYRQAEYVSQAESTRYNGGYLSEGLAGGEPLVQSAVRVSDMPYRVRLFASRVWASAPAVDGNFANGYRYLPALGFRDYDRNLGPIVRLVPAGGFAAAAGPVGLAIAAGSMLGGKLRTGQLDENGFAKTGTSNKIVSSFANVLDPLGNAMGVFKRDDLNFGQKLGATLLPGSSALITASADRDAKAKFEADKAKRFNENVRVANASNTRATYGGLPGSFAHGDLLPRRLADSSRRSGKPANAALRGTNLVGSWG